MPIFVECDSCATKLNIKDEYAGKRVKCPKCGSPIQLPTLEPVLVDDEEEQPAEPPRKSKARRERDQYEDEAPRKQKSKRSPDEDEEEHEDDRPKRKKGDGAKKKQAKKASPLLFVLVGVGALVVLGGIAAVVVVMSQGSAKATTNSTGGADSAKPARPAEGTPVGTFTPGQLMHRHKNKMADDLDGKWVTVTGHTANAFVTHTGADRKPLYATTFLAAPDGNELLPIRFELEELEALEAVKNEKHGTMYEFIGQCEVNEKSIKLKFGRLVKEIPKKK